MSVPSSAPINKYVQGHTAATLATHLSRTAEIDGRFLLPHIKPTDRILDVGCGPGTITTGFLKYAPQGEIVGIDNAPAVIAKAQELAGSANIPTSGPGSVIFEEGDIIKGLKYPAESFDVVYASQVFGHFLPPTLPLQALAEIHRVLKPNGVLATRDAADQHFYPKSCDLDRLWVGRMAKVISHGETDTTSQMMPALLRRAGFDVDSGKVVTGTGGSVFGTAEARKFAAWRSAAQLTKGEPLYENWVGAGFTPEEIEETKAAAAKWAEEPDGWYGALQCEMLAWK